MIFIIICVPLISIGIAAVLGLKHFDKYKRKLLAQATEERLRQEQYLREREIEIQQQTSLAVTTAVNEAREAAMKHYQSTIPEATLEQLHEHLKANVLMFSRMSRLLSVRVAGVPSGWVGIEWALVPSVPEPLRIVGHCEDKLQFSERAYRGFLTRYFRPGKNHHFRIRAYGEQSSWKAEDELEFIIPMPSEKQWNKLLNPPPPPPPDPLAEAKERVERTAKRITTMDELWEQVRRSGMQAINASDDSEIEKRRRRARLEARLIEEQRKEENP